MFGQVVVFPNVDASVHALEKRALRMVARKKRKTNKRSNQRLCVGKPDAYAVASSLLIVHPHYPISIDMQPIHLTTLPHQLFQMIFLFLFFTRFPTAGLYEAPSLQKAV